MMNEPTTRMLWRRIRSTDAGISRPDSMADFLPNSGRPSGVTDSNPMNRPMQPAFFGQIEQLFVVGDVDGRLSDPGLAGVGFGQGAEEFLGPLDMLRLATDEVVVDDEHPTLGDRLELFHHVGDRAADDSAPR